MRRSSYNVPIDALEVAALEADLEYSKVANEELRKEVERLRTRENNLESVVDSLQKKIGTLQALDTSSKARNAKMESRHEIESETHTVSVERRRETLSTAGEQHRAGQFDWAYELKIDSVWARIVKRLNQGPANVDVVARDINAAVSTVENYLMKLSASQYVRHLSNDNWELRARIPGVNGTVDRTTAERILAEVKE